MRNLQCQEKETSERGQILGRVGKRGGMRSEPKPDFFVEHAPTKA